MEKGGFLSIFKFPARKQVWGVFAQFRGLGEEIPCFRPQIQIQHPEISLGLLSDVNWLELKRVPWYEYVEKHKHVCLPASRLENEWLKWSIGIAQAQV